VGYRREEIKKALGDSCEYVTQEEQLGTGHAVLMTEPALRNNAETVIVVNCDTPFISAESIKKLESISETDNHVLRMATVAVPDFSDWKAGFFDFGRIIRDTEGKIQKIVEKKDATETELAITEVNSGLYAFRADWLYDHLHKLENNNIQKEYYLTDLIGMAIQENLTVGSIKIDPKEALGVNTKEHLELLHTL
jgi:bifunctional N-acetylglucosamine-1-phosphate-uridyltransferase/glucosamine-1-phosphate-acetyltransferase GlmU-like protein